MIAKKETGLAFLDIFDPAFRPDSPDAKAAAQWEDYLDGVRKAGSSCGAVIEVTASGVPAGWGAPVYGKLDQDLAGAMIFSNATLSARSSGTGVDD